MLDNTRRSEDNIRNYYNFFQSAFETVDTTSMYWQPFLKAVGRSQLEFAGLHARQSQALMTWMHQMLQPASPMDVVNANAQLCWTLAEQLTEVMPRVATALTSATSESIAAPSVLPLRVNRPRDTLILLDRDHDDLVRKVA